MISPNGGGYISKVVSKLVRNNALISFNRLFFSFQADTVTPFRLAKKQSKCFEKFPRFLL